MQTIPAQMCESVLEDYTAYVTDILLTEPDERTEEQSAVITRLEGCNIPEKEKTDFIAQMQQQFPAQFILGSPMWLRLNSIVKTDETLALDITRYALSAGVISGLERKVEAAAEGVQENAHGAAASFSVARGLAAHGILPAGSGNEGSTVEFDDGTGASAGAAHTTPGPSS